MKTNIFGKMKALPWKEFEEIYNNTGKGKVYQRVVFMFRCGVVQWLAQLICNRWMPDSSTFEPNRGTLTSALVASRNGFERVLNTCRLSCLFYNRIKID